MRHVKLAASFLALVPALIFGFPASAQEKAQETYEPVGQVEITKTELGFIISIGGGRGVLKFKGHEYPLRVGGLGVGGAGIHSTTVTGDVYNMENASDIEGTYGEARAGITLVGASRGVRRLENNRTGVIMTLGGTAAGVRLNIGAAGTRITME